VPGPVSAVPGPVSAVPGPVSAVPGPVSAVPGPVSAVTPAHTIACCHDLLARLGVAARDVAAVLPIGGAARTPGLQAALDRGLGIPTQPVEEPELLVVRGAAHWLSRSGTRVVAAQPTQERVVPLAFTIPGGSAKLLRWLVEPDEPYGEGALLARVRLAGGAVWDLTARNGGVIDQMLVGAGAPVTSGEWLALARH
jgi:hypothetical protein